MAKKSLFSRISKTFQGEKEKTSEDLDRELEDTLEMIHEEEVKQVDGASILKTSWGESGSPVFIMSLAPLYEAIGGKSGRLADSLRESCSHIFSQEVSADKGHGVIDNDFFVMHFSEKMETGFKLAAKVINSIGAHILLERFKSMPVDGLFTVAESDDITNEDGNLDPSRVSDTVKSGGRRIPPMKFGDGAPEWFKTFWKENESAAVDFGESQTIEDKIADWGSTEEKKDNDNIWVAMENNGKNDLEKKERGPDRRQSKEKSFRGKERRTSWRPRRLEDSMRVS